MRVGALRIGLLAAILTVCAPMGLAVAEGASQAATAAQAPVQTIGIVGGVSWLSSAEYYRRMNEMVRDRLGGLHSAQILMFSIEFGEFSKQERLADRGDWVPLVATMIDAA